MAEQKQQQKDKRTTLPGKIFGIFITILIWLFISLLISIVLEWIGMIYFWPEQGTQHARNMYHQELSYINEGFNQKYVSQSQLKTISDIYRFYEDLGEKLSINSWLSSISQQTYLANLIRDFIHAIQRFSEYLIAAGYIIQVFVLRLSILIISWSSFAIAFLIGATDGLVLRDLRTWGGGRESTSLYLLGKYSIIPLLMGPWIVYLSLPFSIHPVYILLPFIFLFGLSIRLFFERMKKYI